MKDQNYDDMSGLSLGMSFRLSPIALLPDSMNNGKLTQLNTTIILRTGVVHRNKATKEKKKKKRKTL